MKDQFYGPNYRVARGEAFARSGGTCQGCGKAQATEAHHWKYVPDEEVTSDHLTAVCGVCHLLLTTLRRQLSRGADRFELHSVIEEAIASCSTESQSAGLARSFTTTGQPGLTPEVLSAVRSQRSRPNAVAIAPQPTTTGFESSKPNALFGSTRAERLRFQQRLSDRRSKPGPASESKGRKSGAGWSC